ncbi:MAG: excinuclease ABC subunit UvrA [Bacteroidaceae bacterium]|nr:excinuclease ABC subunit UvrA [Bacteroidaceae bacterium]
MDADSEWINIRGARANNLKNADVRIPRDRFTVITGLSGSGKSSLAFDTLYAEGQRRYVESLSAYARQFLGRMKKPECDGIEGLPPTIAIGQRSGNRNPRSTVGTRTEIYDYLKLLFARIGRTISPISGVEVSRHSVEDVVDFVKTQVIGTRFTVLSPIRIIPGRSLEQQLAIYMKEGYSRIDLDGQMLDIDEFRKDSHLLESMSASATGLSLLVDRLAVSDTRESISRLTDSIETAFYEGSGECMLRFYIDGGNRLYSFSNRFEADGIRFQQPSENLFSFNSPMGACPKCEGFGRVVGIDEDLVIPNRSLSVYDGCVVCWRGEKMVEWKNYFILQAQKHDFPIFTPYYQLTDSQKDYLWHGSGIGPDENGWDEACIDNFFKMLEKNQYKIQYRVMLARYRGKTACPMCHGKRLKKEAEYVHVGGRPITDLVEMPISELKLFFDNLVLSKTDSITASRILSEITSRLQFMIDTGLEYLTLNRSSATLSGGESQRISLVTSLGSSLMGSLYVLDEPSIGLHSRDTEKLIRVLRQLQGTGNTVVVVEHDEEIIRAADYIIDVGPDAGRHGGEIVYQGNVANLDSQTSSWTVRYLTGSENIPVPTSRRPWNSYIEIKGARQNNLKGIDVKFPLGVMTVVTGVSGSGKSTLVRDILYQKLKAMYDEAGQPSGQCSSIEGDTFMVKAVEFVDQDPIGKTTRSNPVTYVKAYDEIRKLFADQPLSHQMGYRPTHFSFNSEGGRCEECKGEGTVTVSMQFMSDLTLECESCHGKRFKKDVLEVTYKDRNIWEILEMTVNQAIEFFSSDDATERKIVHKLKPLQQVGLGYVKLGQASSTLSGGESQRVKLAYFLSLEKAEPTIFIFDEPTTGLHFHDIRRLLESFDALIRRGHTVIIIEHNMDVIKCADHLIDLGPEGGSRGGNLVIAGTPEQVAKCPESITGHFLKSKLQ